MKRLSYIFALLISLLCFGCISNYATAKKKSARKRHAASQIDGIDISHHNGRINWGKVTKKHKDIRFVYIKATEGISYTDSYYSYNLKHARKKGILAGSYHFFSYSRPAKEQFRHFSSTVDANKQDIIPMVDFERYGSKKNADKVIKELKKFCQMVKDHYGVYPMIYTNEHIYNELLWKDFGKYHLFIANYRSEPSLKGNARYTIWQYSDKGRLEGVDENVDLNRFHHTFSIYDITYSKKKKRR